MSSEPENPPDEAPPAETAAEETVSEKPPEETAEEKPHEEQPAASVEPPAPEAAPEGEPQALEAKKSAEPVAPVSTPEEQERKALEGQKSAEPVAPVSTPEEQEKKRESKVVEGKKSAEPLVPVSTPEEQEKKASEGAEPVAPEEQEKGLEGKKSAEPVAAEPAPEEQEKRESKALEGKKSGEPVAAPEQAAAEEQEKKRESSSLEGKKSVEPVVSEARKSLEEKRRESQEAEMLRRESTRSVQSLRKRSSKESEKDLFVRRKSQRSIRGAVGSVISFRRGSIAEYYDRQRAAKFMNTYKLESDKPFNVDRVTKILEDVLVEALENLTYDADKVPKQAKWASSAIRARVKEQEYDSFIPEQVAENPSMAPEDHAGDKAPARRNSANGANLMIDLEYLKRKQSACACEEDVEDFARRLVEDVRIEGVPLIPAVDANEFSFNLLSYLGRVAISEQSLEVSGDLSESGDEEIPSGLGSMVSHKSFPLNDEKHAGKFFSIVPVGEEEPPTCFPEEGEETPSMSECFCQANLRAFAERVETPESSTKSDEAELTPKRIVSDEDDTISDKQRHKVSFGSAAPRQDFRSNALCDQYDSVNVIADKFVGWVLKAAVSALSWSDKQEAEEEEGEEEEEEGEGDIGEIHFKGAVCSLVTFVESYNFSWPTIRDFTPQIGMNAIREYIGTWYYTENWTYDIKLVLRQSDECSDYFTFETRWGIPTKQYPIPQVTASIFFVVDVSRVKPVDCLVDITYYFEGCSYMQEPFVNFFDEKQLFDIVNAKLKFYKQLKF